MSDRTSEEAKQEADRRGFIRERPEFGAFCEGYIAGHEAARVKELKLELAYLRLQRDALLEITWLDLPYDPGESTAKWREEFSKGWVRRSESPTVAGENKIRVELDHYYGLFEEIRQVVAPITPTDATKKEIIDKIKELVVGQPKGGE